MIKKIKITIFVVMITTILFSLISCSNFTAITDSTVLPEKTVASVATFDLSGVKTAEIGSEVTAGDIVWKVLNVEDQGSGIVSVDNYTLDAVHGKFIILEFMIKNNSGEGRILYDLNVIDNKGRVYAMCLPAYAYFGSEKACALVEIIPGVDLTYEAPFDVSPDSEDLILEVTDLLNPPAVKAYIDLGI